MIHKKNNVQSKLIQEKNMIEKIIEEKEIKYYIANNEVRIDTEAVATLFNKSPRNIREHIKNMIKNGEIDERELRRENFLNLYKSLNPKRRGRTPYLLNQDHIILLGFKVKSQIAIDFRKWAVKVIKERLDENKDPSLILTRAIKGYEKKGYSKEWIRQRLEDKGYRIGFTHELQKHGVKKNEYGIITNTMYISWAGKNAREYYEYKELDRTKDNLRDHFTVLESGVNGLGELTAKELIKIKEAKGFEECNELTKEAGEIARINKENIEKKLGMSIVTKKNNKQLI